MNNGWKLIVTSVLGIAVSSAAVGQNAPQDPVQQRQVARDLCRVIVDSIAELPPGAGTADIEAAVVFAISQVPVLQEGASEERQDRIVELALNCAAGNAGRENVSLAINNVRNSYNIGTGATLASGSGGAGGFGGSFSPPLVGIGGGSTNYTAGQ